MINNQKKILFLCTEGFDTPSPSNHLYFALLQDTINNGFHITYVQSRRMSINPEIPKELENEKNLKIITISRPIVKKSFFVLRYFEEAFYHFKAFAKWRKEGRFDGVFVQSSPTSIFSIFLAKVIKKFPVLYSIQDMWPGSAVSSGVLNNKWIAVFFYKFQKYAYRKSDIITVLSNDMKKKLLSFGVDEKKIHTIVNWYDEKNIKEIDWESNRFVKKYNLSKEKFYIQYAGTMGYVFDFNTILSVAERLESFKDIEFHMIGSGSQKESFIKEVHSKKLGNIHFFPLEPQEMVADVYSACSITLIPLKIGIIGNSVPSKASLVLACNRTIINSVDEDSDYFKMFNENNIGLSVSNKNSNNLLDAIMDLYTNKKKRNKLAENGFNYAKSHYNRKSNTIKFISLFDSLVLIKK
jgi:glycosyltransferase involved in cell wall biosynthesis